MRKLVLTIFSICLITTSAFPQEPDTADIRKVELEEISVTATLTSKKLLDVPAQVDIISADKIRDFPVSNIDDLLKTSSNINVNRSWGIFSKNSSVTMRGLEGSARVLVLIDGVPKNKLGGGSVNWHNINPSTIDRIEVIKGPASSLYGNNAMGGVINIITKRPDEKFAGEIEGFGGSFMSMGGSLNLSGTYPDAEKGFYWNLNGFYRRGDGYIFELPEFMDETDVPTYLNEYGGGGKIGYRFDRESSLEVNYDYYDETRGAGRKVHLEDGSYEAYGTHQLRATYRDKIAGGDLNTILYYNRESYYGQKESLNDYGVYRLMDSWSDKADMGIWSGYSRILPGNNMVTVGVEGKSGSLDGEEIYRTSPDVINFRSRMNIFGLFAQDEIGIIRGKLDLIAGIRMDLVRFIDGYQSVQDPTSVTGFPEGFEEYFSPASWTAISPKLALRYSLSKRDRIYASYSSGFMPPGLKDLAQTGKIRRGFRLANPGLKPEYIDNYELGYKGLIGSKLSLSAAVYYSIGRDFQYMVSTGELIDTGGSSLKPVMKPDNVARVGIAGAELSLDYYLGRKIRLNGGYSYNNSRLIEYDDGGVHPDQSIEGNRLVEVSPHIFYGSATYRGDLFNININCNYVDEQWYDDENTIKIDDYFLLNFRISREIGRKFNIYLNIQNILNNEYVDRKGRLNPGRFIITGLRYKVGAR